VVSRDAGRRRALVIRAIAGAAIAVGMLAVAGACTSGGDRARSLPADREAAVLYVALGDSTVEGVAATSPARNYVSRLHERLRAIYPAARVRNLGRGGAVSQDVLSTQLPRAVELRPDLVTMSVGPNDITEGVSVEDYARTIDRILGTLVRDTRAVVIVNLLPDLAVTPRFRSSGERERVGELTVRFNDALTRKARAHRVTTVDLYTASRDEVPRHPELVAADGYHPSDLGYERWAELMWAAVEQRVARR
jgi:acyl-CoA thioesterase I